MPSYRYYKYENTTYITSVDEIESITISRSSLFKGSEPSDSIRAVNVLLTQIDQIKELDNILILATSNMLETVDAAFLDRVDLKFKLGRPSQRAMYVRDFDERDPGANEERIA